jgi:hypothetical protein
MRNKILLESVQESRSTCSIEPNKIKVSSKESFEMHSQGAWAHINSTNSLGLDANLSEHIVLGESFEVLSGPPQNRFGALTRMVSERIKRELNELDAVVRDGPNVLDQKAFVVKKQGLKKDLREATKTLNRLQVPSIVLLELRKI